MNAYYNGVKVMGFLKKIIGWGKTKPEHKIYHIVLTDAGLKKVNAIKCIRSLTGLGLYDAKNIVDSLGLVSVVVGEIEADIFVNELKFAGCEAEKVKV